MSKKNLETYWVDVLGCKVNQYDARQIARLLEQYGLRQAPAPERADLVVVHTCGVTAAAAQKSRQAIRRMQRENPDATVVVTGCAAGETLTRVDQAPALRVPAGTEWLRNLARQLETLPTPQSGVAETVATDTFSALDFGGHTRAFLKVQDGCDIGCSYCIVPQLRKAPRDKPVEAAVAEAARLAEKGYREIVVTGVSVGLYGRKTGGSLAGLLRCLAEVPGIGRIRLSSLHPGELTDELLEVWAGSEKVMPHLHLSLQSGSDTILRAMRRGYTAAEYLAAVGRARAALGNPAFTTDVIVGFPGETDAHFEESLAFCREVGFSQMHIFTYSPRPGTPAAKMDKQVNGAIAAQRAVRLREEARRMALAFHRQFVGKPVEVLVERTEGGSASGYSRHYVPVGFQSLEARKGRVERVVPQRATASGLEG